MWIGSTGGNARAPLWVLEMSEDVFNFCSFRVVVPIERFQIVLTRNARDAESKLFFLMFNNTLRRVGDYCTVRHWTGGAGTFGWLSGFEDQTCH
jgi:hypothetical protein